MTVAAERTKLKMIQPLRALYLQSTNFQIRYDACHDRGWTDSYILTSDGLQVGYGSVMGRDRADRDTVFEFFVIPSFRRQSSALFRALLAASGARYIECQSNDLGLTALLFEFAREISADVILFEDHAVSRHVVPGGIVRRRRKGDAIFAHAVEPVGDYVLEVDGEVVATGGFLLQELKRECHLAGRVPAARCDLRNAGSRGALTNAGMRVCGFMLAGVVRSDFP